MAEPTILRHNDWAGLIDDLATRCGRGYFNSIPLQVASAVLAAPAAIARWIALRAPQLARARTITVLVIGAETTDAPDEGRWYQLLPQLLDGESEIRVTLIGGELDTGFRSAAHAHAPQTAAQCQRVALAEFLAMHQAAKYDLAAVFQPGLQKHRGWLAAGGFNELVAAGVPVIGSSYEVDEYEMDRWVLECYGYSVSSEPLINPFVLELGDDATSIRWGRALWRIESAPPACVVDEQKLNALDTLTNMVMHSMTEVRSPSPGYGEEVELAAEGGRRLRLVHVFDRRFVAPATGAISLLTADGELRSLGRIPAEVLARYPGNAARNIERAVWAGEVKSRYLLDTYASRADTRDGEGTARDMLAAMRDKAMRFFR